MGIMDFAGPPSDDPMQLRGTWSKVQEIQYYLVEYKFRPPVVKSLS